MFEAPSTGSSRSDARTRPSPRIVAACVVRGLLAALILCLPVAVLATLVKRGFTPMLDLDQRVILAATDVTRAHPTFKAALLAWQAAFHPVIVYLYAVPVAVWAWRRGLRSRVLWGVATMLVGWNLGWQVKLIVRRARPVVPDPVSHSPGFSFPSGHTFNVTMMAATCLLMTWPLLRRRPARVRALVIGASVIVVLLTVLDRIFLGVHFPSDVTAGVLLGLGLSFASAVGFGAWAASTPPTPTDSDDSRAERSV